MFFIDCPAVSHLMRLMRMSFAYRWRAIESFSKFAFEYGGQALACPFIEGRVRAAHREEAPRAALLPKD